MDYLQLYFILRNIGMYMYVVLRHDISCIRKLLFTIPVLYLTTLLTTGTKKKSMMQGEDIVIEHV
jgi:hypothetical protein